MNLIIVESPTKAKTIQRFLPADFVVRSSYGHVRDLPKGKLGVDTEHNFEPKYVVSIAARKKLAEIKKVLPKAKKVILASDEDREGEAIAWHLTQALDLETADSAKSNPPPTPLLKGGKGGLKKSHPSEAVVERIVFHEITKGAIEKALQNPREIDMDLVNAQQARRILDRLVGYELSPFLWKKIAKGLSAGRVQSVAVRLIVEREREIQKFKPEEYWSIVATLLKLKSQNSKVKTEENTEGQFDANLIRINDKQIPKLGIKTQAEAQKIVDDLAGAAWQVANIEQKDTQKHPAPPFVTSTLQQDAVNKLHFSAKQTMQIAQQLYEGIALGKEGSVGLITYMRTDSTNLAQEALSSIGQYIIDSFGKEYLPENARVYKTKSKGAQEAHEAIRPTLISLAPEKIEQFLTPQQYKLYDLIWRRTLACQMASAVINTLTVDVDAKGSHGVILTPQQRGKDLKKDSSVAELPQNDKNNIYIFRANGSQIKFDGFLKIYNGKMQENILPPLEVKENLNLVKLNPGQHFTQPPARYSEASIIKALEAEGIGRPSTYAPIISTIQERNYVNKDENRKFMPTEIGFKVNDLLVEHFPQVVDIKFTAHIEEDFDRIAEGEIPWTEVIKEFYEPFKVNLTKKYDEVKEQKTAPEATDKICPKCGAPVVIRTSRFGKFYACSNFPKCRYTASVSDPNAMACPKCVEGKVIARRTKRGKMFYGCSRYPECDFALWDKPTGDKCPKCESPLIENKHGVKCSNKECDYKEKEAKPTIKE
ncbi:MAG: type I DNA topoisomerase [Candidatus Portnoybacteria bacterium]|nr:type I DNA topoisomerase [Candidatus Portnoybacteria bacterium]MDD4982622.1 type I DNA topoisomerase [Candidatus Portnoybacteria bacterium]